MRKTNMPVRGCAATLAATLFIATSAAQPAAEIELQVVKYDGLKQVIQANRGKVVLVDFWFFFCHPCKENMPHLVELHDRYGKEGLVVVTVDNDAPESKARSLGFLKQIGARFTNLLLDEPGEVFEQKLRIGTYPCYYVFDRQGRWRQFTGSETRKVDLVELDAFIAQALKEQP